MNNSPNIEIYNKGTYLAKNPAWHIGDSAWKASHIQRLFIKNGVSPKSIAEVGCGAGRVIAEIAQRYQTSQCKGFDVSSDASKFWSQEVPINLTYELINFTETNGHFDALMLIDVFEHVDDYLGFLRHMSTRANHLILHIPLDLSVSTLLSRGYMRTRADVGHLHYFTRESALATLDYAGLEVLDCCYTALSIEASLDKRTWKTKLMNVARRLLATISANAAATLLGGYSIMVLTQPKQNVAKRTE